MPPRIPISTCLRASKPSTLSQSALPIRLFSCTPIAQARPPPPSDRKRKSQDPYIIAQANRKKAANLSRRAELNEARTQSLGDPVRGVSTPFVQSLDTGAPVDHAENMKIPKDEFHLNYALRPNDVQKSLKISEKLAVPKQEVKKSSPYSSIANDRWLRGLSGLDDAAADAATEAKEPPEDPAVRQAKDHARASEAIQRITALDNGSSKDRLRVNITRCVNTFGRHNTDKIFPPKGPGLKTVDSTELPPVRPETNIAATKKRVGPDTGSSEVQIAILTAKIKALADFLETRGKGDKHNKRNLRLLVHKRAKHLQYLRRKERGGPRWQHCIETLGLTEGTWKGEITL